MYAITMWGEEVTPDFKRYNIISYCESNKRNQYLRDSNLEKRSSPLYYYICFVVHGECFVGDGSSYCLYMFNNISLCTPRPL